MSDGFINFSFGTWMVEENERQREDREVRESLNFLMDSLNATYY